ncbi:MAG: hypothetical protein GC137_05770 [Alphaproteobacteria bacterium]|nr:hypothetical protein [Alphaproteobacteria bacterium]
MTFCSIRNIVYICLVCFTLALALPARAEISIAVVDIEKILSDSKAAQSARKQIDEERKKFLGDIKKEEDKLRNEQKSLEEKSKEISKEELLQKVQDFETRRIEARKSIQSDKDKLDAAYTTAMNTLTKSIYDVCQKIADENEIDLVITRQNIIVGSRSLDITDQVMEELNKKLPNLSLKVK